MKDTHSDMHPQPEEGKWPARSNKTSARELASHCEHLYGRPFSTSMAKAALTLVSDLAKTSETIRLSDEERDRFLDLLEEPIKPNSYFDGAFEKYLHQRLTD